MQNAGLKVFICSGLLAQLSVQILARYIWRMYRLQNMLIGLAAVIPGVIMALGAWHYFAVLPALGIMLQRSLGSVVIILIIAWVQPRKDLKKVSQIGISVGFLWTLTAMLLELEM